MKVSFVLCVVLIILVQSTKIVNFQRKACMCSDANIGRDLHSTIWTLNFCSIKIPRIQKFCVFVFLFSGMHSNIIILNIYTMYLY